MIVMMSLHSAGDYAPPAPANAAPGLMMAVVVLTIVTVVLIGGLVKGAGAVMGMLGRDIRLPPGTSGLPLLGETVSFLRADKCGRGFVEARRARYGDPPVFRTSLFFRPTAVLGGPDASRFLFSQEAARLLRPAYPSSVLQLFGRHSIMAHSGPRHKRLRGLLLSCLSPPAIRRFVPTVAHFTRRHLAEHWRPPRLPSLHAFVKSHTLNVASTLLVGLPVDDDDDLHRKARFNRLFEAFVMGLISLPVYFPGTRFYKAHLARASLLQLFRDLIRERGLIQAAAAPADAVVVDDVLSSFVNATDEDGKPLTTDEILDNLLTLLYAGHDTTTSTIVLACKYISQHPSCYEQLLQEHTMIANTKRPREELTWDDLQKMKYTWCVIQETMRHEPTSSFTFRAAVKEFEYKGFKIPYGWTIFHILSYSCMDAKYFLDPTAFNPPRFLDGPLAPNTFLPFGGGSRMCPGYDFAKMVILIFFHHLILTNIKWELENPQEGLYLKAVPTPLHGFPLKLFNS